MKLSIFQAAVAIGVFLLAVATDSQAHDMQSHAEETADRTLRRGRFAIGPFEGRDLWLPHRRVVQEGAPDLTMKEPAACGQEQEQRAQEYAKKNTSAHRVAKTASFP